MPKTISQELVEKTFRELSQAAKPRERSRISQTHNGYIFLVAWSNASLLRILVRTFTDTLPRSEHRLKAQLDDAARSTVANIEEGYSRPTTSQYLDFLGFSYASLIEVKGDTQRSLKDGFLKSVPGSTLAGINIDLQDWHEALKKSVISKPSVSKILQSPVNSSRGFYRNLQELKGRPEHVYTAIAGDPQLPLNSFKFLYPPVDNLKPRDLTCEIFIELINKTDWHLRRLVESLENKLNQDQQFYKVEQARIRSKLKMK